MKVFKLVANWGAYGLVSLFATPEVHYIPGQWTDAPAGTLLLAFETEDAARVFRAELARFVWCQLWEAEADEVKPLPVLCRSAFPAAITNWWKDYHKHAGDLALVYGVDAPIGTVGCPRLRLTERLQSWEAE